MQAIYPTLVIVLVNSSRVSHKAYFMGAALPPNCPGVGNANAARPDRIVFTTSSFTTNTNTFPGQAAKNMPSNES